MSGCVEGLVDPVAVAGVAEQLLSLAVFRFFVGGLVLIAFRCLRRSSLSSLFRFISSSFSFLFFSLSSFLLSFSSASCFFFSLCSSNIAKHSLLVSTLAKPVHDELDFVVNGVIGVRCLDG